MHTETLTDSHPGHVYDWEEARWIAQTNNELGTEGWFFQPRESAGGLVAVIEVYTANGVFIGYL